MVRLGLISEDEAQGSLKKAARHLAKAGYVHSFRVTTLLFTLQQKSNGDCVFLSERRLCTVYDKRPDVCRKFPAIGPRPGFCPAQKSPAAASRPSDAAKRSSKPMDRRPVPQPPVKITAVSGPTPIKDAASS